MRRLSHFLVSLYPRSWRERYGEEFSALIEDVRPTRQTVANVMKGALERTQTWRFGQILLTAGILGALTIVIAHFAIPDRAEAAITVSGPADGTAAGNAVMSLASSQFRHATLASVNKVTDSSQGNTSFTVKFTYDGSYGALASFVHEHRANRTAGDFEILTISSRALNKWLIPLVAISVTAVAIAFGVAFRLQSVRRTA
jgi:hypothetical protein